MHENCFGKGTKLYRDTVIRSTTTGEDCVIGDDCFVTDTVLGKRCTLERRNMVFNSTLGDYSNTGVNSVITFAQIGKFDSISHGVSIGGADHDFHALTTHSFPFNGNFGIAPDLNAGGGVAVQIQIHAGQAYNR